MSPFASTDPLAAYRVAREPFYQPNADELSLFEAAHAQRLPLILKGPTGCGKTRFTEHMAWRLKRPLVTVACHKDHSTSDLIGRWLLDGDGTRWQDGPLTLAARFGGICYLDELVEARANTTVVIHPLTDTRRMLPLAPRNELVHAHPDFQLVVSYNPTPTAREMKASTRQRFARWSLPIPIPSLKPASLHVSRDWTSSRGGGLDEEASTRMLVNAAVLAAQGLSLASACRLAMVDALSGDGDVQEALQCALDASF